MNLDTLLLVLAVGVAAFFNLVLPWLRKQQQAMEDAQTESLRQEHLRSAGDVVSGTAPPAAVLEPETPRAPGMSAAGSLAEVSGGIATHAVAGRSPRGRLTALRDVRSAIVLAAILGPCRAQAPHV